MTTETTEAEAAPMTVTKRSKKKKHSDETKHKENAVLYHFQGLRIGKKSTTVYFEREVINELRDGEEDNTTFRTWYPVESEHPPHPDLLRSMKDLTKYGLALVEMEIEGSKSAYTIIEVKINGDMEMEQSRAELIIGKKVKRTDKIVKIPTGEYVMYGESDFADASKCTALIESVKEEAWAYAFDGKYGTEDPNQLPLFTK